MKNAGLTIGMVAIGLGLASIGFNLNGNQAIATPAAYHAGAEEPVIVWYDQTTLSSGSSTGYKQFVLFRAWSDGTIEARVRWFDLFDGVGNDCLGTGDGVPDPDWDDPKESDTCPGYLGWFVISSPNEGLNARADINLDEIVDGADMGLLLSSWGKAPRSPIPASDCPLGLMQ